MSASSQEEIIACLWTIIAVLLWANDAMGIFTVLAFVKAALDHACAIMCAVKEGEAVEKARKGGAA